MTRKVEGRALFQGGTARLCLVPGGDAAFLHSVAAGGDQRMRELARAYESDESARSSSHASKCTYRDATKQGE